jgi:TPP-dependent pyruvate/acetoin dehydrogenase alpha subunit
MALEKAAKKQPKLDEVMTREEAIHWLKIMLLGRAFEENAEELYNLGKTHGTMHLSIGQEAVAVGIRSALKATDYFFNTHRGHTHFLAWGGELNGLMAEFMGKATGVCHGRGGSMHIADIKKNIIGSNGILGSSTALSLGYGINVQLRKTDQLVLVIFGDGGANEGVVHESMNLAAIWKLPIIFFCENNSFAMSMRFKDAVAIKAISERACAYGMPGITVDGNDVLAVNRAVKDAADYVRAGKGPYLVEALTYRVRGHSRSDRQNYRTREEVKEWISKEKDPIHRFVRLLNLSDEDMEKLGKEAKLEIKKALEFAENSPEPSIESIEEGTYA